MLRVERDGGVALLVLDRPKTHNALDEATLIALEDATKIDARAFVITGQGAFCSGGDLAELKHRGSAEDAAAISDLGARVLAAIEAAPLVIAAIDGVAFGGGAELALACDVRIAGDGAKIGFKQAQMGATTAWGTTARLLQTTGRGVASLLLLTGREIDADEAVALGLCELRAKDARAAAVELAKSACACGPSAVKELKALISAGGARDRERAAFVRTWSGAEHAAAIAAYFEGHRRT